MGVARRARLLTLFWRRDAIRNTPDRDPDRLALQAKLKQMVSGHRPEQAALGSRRLEEGLATASAPRTGRGADHDANRSPGAALGSVAPGAAAAPRRGDRASPRTTAVVPAATTPASSAPSSQPRRWRRRSSSRIAARIRAAVGWRSATWRSGLGDGVRERQRSPSGGKESPLTSSSAPRSARAVGAGRAGPAPGATARRRRKSPW